MKKKNYTALVIGVLVVYIVLVYFIRRKMGISSTLEDLQFSKTEKGRIEEIKRTPIIAEEVEEQGIRVLTETRF